MLVHVVLRLTGLGVILALGIAVLTLLEEHVPFVLLFFVFVATVHSLGWLLGSHPTLQRLLKDWRDSRTYWGARYRLLRNFTLVARRRLNDASA